MLPPPLIENETGRLAALQAHEILDTLPEAEYDDVVRLAAHICGTPMASVTFVAEARQWFKAAVGLDSGGGPRETAFCAHAVATGNDDMFIVRDADLDPRFHGNPYVTGSPNIRFYAGAPLVTPDGFAIGTLCVIDRRPRDLTPEQLAALNALRRYVLRSLELRRLARVQEATIKELEQTQAELRKARATAEAATAAQGLYFATMTHEIRTPLSAVVGMTTLLRDTPLTPEQADCTETIRSSSEMLLAVVNDLLDFSKIESGRVELEDVPFEVRPVVSEAVRVVAQAAKEKGLPVEIDVAPGVPAQVAGDATRLRQILVNLLSNAVKFTDRGRVTVRVRPAGDAAGRPRLHFSVTDTGIGLTAEQLRRLFQVFGQADRSTTRRYGGSGLGLAISKRLAELHGGEMWVESTAGMGSTFHFTLALRAVSVATEAPTSAAVFDATFATRHPCRLLVAEDNAINQKVMRSMLRRLGYEPVIVSDGNEAITALQTGSYDVLLTDVEMPGLNGPAATARIRADFPSSAQPVIIALTAHAGANKREELLAGGMDEYLAKPVQPEKLTGLLARWSDLRRAA